MFFSYTDVKLNGEAGFFVRLSQTEIELPKTLSIVGGWQVFIAYLMVYLFVKVLAYM